MQYSQSTAVNKTRITIKMKLCSINVYFIHETTRIKSNNQFLLISKTAYWQWQNVGLTIKNSVISNIWPLQLIVNIFSVHLPYLLTTNSSSAMLQFIDKINSLQNNSSLMKTQLCRHSCWYYICFYKLAISVHCLFNGKICSLKASNKQFISNICSQALPTGTVHRVLGPNKKYLCFRKSCVPV